MTELGVIWSIAEEWGSRLARHEVLYETAESRQNAITHHDGWSSRVLRLDSGPSPAGQLCDLSVSQPDRHSAKQSASHSISQSVSKPASQTFSQVVSQSFNQSPLQPVSQSVNSQSVSQPVNQSASQSASQPITSAAVIKIQPEAAMHGTTMWSDKRYRRRWARWIYQRTTNHTFWLVCPYD